jgi:hypothetical protein
MIRSVVSERTYLRTISLVLGLKEVVELVEGKEATYQIRHLIATK